MDKICCKITFGRLISFVLLLFSIFVFVVVDCKLSEWTEWGTCNQTCGTGTQNRSRHIEIKATRRGKCEGNLAESQVCNTHECPGK